MAARDGVAGGLAPAYLIAGSDLAKIDAAIGRLRRRAEGEGGPGALETFTGDAVSSAEGLVGSIPALSLTATRRYLIAEGVERWGAAEVKLVVAALGDLPPDVTVVLVAREEPPRRKAAKPLTAAVEGAGGAVHRYDAPRARDLPRHLVREAGRRGFALESDAAELLVDRLGDSTVRLASELDRLAVWVEEGGTVTREDLEAMIADTSEEVAWALSDALVDRDNAAAAAAASRLLDQGESVTPLVYQAAKRLREARMALDGLEAGRPAKDVEASLPMHPYAAKLLVRRVQRSTPEALRGATCAVADLEWWTRGGSDYPDDLALALAVARATGAARRGRS
jgi:DNA polymerase III subunit delta